jgi:hypothetical protein
MKLVIFERLSSSAPMGVRMTQMSRIFAEKISGICIIRVPFRTAPISYVTNYLKVLTVPAEQATA